MPAEEKGLRSLKPQNIPTTVSNISGGNCGCCLVPAQGGEVSYGISCKVYILRFKINGGRHFFFHKFWRPPSGLF